MTPAGQSPDTSLLNSREVLRPAPKGLKGMIGNAVMRSLPFLFGVARAVWPIPKLGSKVITTRYDDVLDVFANDPAFGVPYKKNLDVIMGNEPFFLSMGDTPAYHAGRDAMLRVVRPRGHRRRGSRPQAEAMAEAIVAEAGGRLDVVDSMVRSVTFDLLGDYFGVPKPARRRPSRLGHAPVRIPVRGRRQRGRCTKQVRPDRAGAARPYRR